MKNQIDQSTPFLAFYDLLRIRGIYSDEEKREKLRRGFRRAMALAAILVGLLLPQGAGAAGLIAQKATGGRLQGGITHDFGSGSLLESGDNVRLVSSMDSNDLTTDRTIFKGTSKSVEWTIDGGELHSNGDVWFLNFGKLDFNGGTLDVHGLLAAAMSDYSSSFHKEDVFEGSSISGNPGVSGAILIAETVGGSADTVVATKGMSDHAEITVGGGKITFSGTTGAGTKLKAGTVEMDGSTVAGDATTSVSATGDVTGNFSQSGGSVKANAITGTLTQSGATATAEAATISSLRQTVAGATAKATTSIGTLEQTAAGTATTAAVTGNATVAGKLEGIDGLSVGSLAQSAGTINANGVLTIGSGAASQQTGGTITASDTTLAAGTQNVSLNQAGNSLGTVSGTAGAVTVANAGAIQLGALTASSLDVTAGGAVTQSGAANVSGATMVTAKNTANVAQDITLTQANNKFGSIGATGANISITEADATALNAVTATGTLTVNAGGAVTQNGAANVSGAATVTAKDASNAAQNITLTQENNTFGSIGATGANVQITESDAVALGVINASALTVTAGGAVSQVANTALTVSDATTVKVADGSNVTLANDGNKFGSVGVVGKTANTGAAGEVTIVDSDSSLALNATRASKLDVTAAGAITQSGAVTATEKATFSGTSVTLGNSGNAMGARLGATATDGNVSIVNNGAIRIEAGQTVSGKNVSLEALGDEGYIFIDKPTAVDPTAVVSATDATSGTITLASHGAIGQGLPTTGIYQGTGAGVAAKNLVVHAAKGDGTALDVALDRDGDSNVNSVQTLSGDGGSVKIKTATALELGALNVASLDATAGGAVTQTAAANVSGDTSVKVADGSNVTLDNTGNKLGAIAVSGNSENGKAGQVTIVDSEGNIDLTNVKAETGITANATAGKVTATGAIETGALDVTAGNGAINLKTKAATVSANATGGVKIQDVSDKTAAGLTIAGAKTDSGNVEISSDNNKIVVTDDVTAGEGPGGTLEIAGAEINAPVSAASEQKVAINGKGADLVIGVNLGSDGTDLTLSANRDVIIQSGATVLGATVSLKADQDGKVAETGTDAGSEGGVFVAGTVQAMTGDAKLTGTKLNYAAATGKGVYFDGGTVDAAGNITIVDKSGADTFQTGEMSLTASGGAINLGAGGGTPEEPTLPSGIEKAIQATGAVTLAQKGALTLANKVSTGTAALTLTSSEGAVTMGEISSGSLTVNAGGEVKQTAAATVGGAVQVNAEGQNVTLANDNNSFGSVGVTGAKVEIKEKDAVALRATTASGTFNVTAGGNITQSGDVSATGTTTLDAGANAITLNRDGNDFGETVTVQNTPASVNIHDANALDVAAVTTAGSAELVAGGALTTKAVTATAGNAAVIGGAGATVGGNLTAGGNAVVVSDGGAATVNGNIQAANVGLQGATVANNGTVAQGVNQLAIVQTGGAEMTLTDDTIPTGAQTVGIRSAGNLTVTSDHDLVFGNASVSAGGRTVAANGLASTAGTVEATTAGNIASSAITGAAGTTVTTENGGAINVAGDLGQGGETVVNANGAAVTAGTLASGDLLDVNNAGAVNANIAAGGAAQIQAASLQAGNTAAGGNLTFDTVTGPANVGNLAVGGDVNGTVNGLFTTAGGQVGSIGQQGGFNAPGGATVDGNLNSGPVLANTGAFTVNGALNAGGNAVVLNTAATTLNGGLTGGNVTINAGGPVTGGGALAAGQLNIAAGGNAITLPNVQSANLNNITGGNITLTDTTGQQITIGTINAGGVLDLTLNSAAGTAGGGNLTANGTMTLTVNGPFGTIAAPVVITINGGNPVLNIDGSGIDGSLLHFILNGALDPGDFVVNYLGEGFAIYGSQQAGWQIIGIGPEKQRLLNRALAFSVNTPELKSKQGIFGDPAMLHTRMNVSEARPGANMDMLALKSVDFPETWKDVSEAGGDLAEWTPAVYVDEAPLLPKLEALASEVQLQPEIQPYHGSTGNADAKE